MRPLIHKISAWTVGLITRPQFMRATVESLLWSFNSKAERDGITETAIPLWYRWLRASYFASLRSELPNKEFQQRFWELGSLTAYKRYLSVDLEDERTQAFLQVVRSQIASIDSKKQLGLLEVGCGDGLLLRDALAHTKPKQLILCGIDISLSGLRIAKQVAGASVQLIQGNVCAMPFTRRFDIGCGRGVLMFIDPTSIVAAIGEIVRTCDRYVLAEPSTESGKRIKQELLQSSVQRDDFDQTSWVHPYISLFENAGAKLIVSEQIGGNCLMVFDCCDRRRGDSL